MATLKPLLVGLVVLGALIGGWPVAGEKPEDPESQWKEIKSSLRSNKKAMCSFLLNKEQSVLTLDGVTDLFEQSFNHLAKSTDYTKVLRPYMSEQALREYDNTGSSLVLEVSENRRDLVAKYRAAEVKGASEEEKRELLTFYFYKACSSKLATVVAEKSMHESMMKVVRRMERVVAHPKM